MDLYNQERRRFFAYLIRRGADYQLACDILQETFARLYAKYRPERFSPALLYTIGRNLLLDALRARRRHSSAQQAAEPPADDPEHDLMVRDEYRRVLDAMRHLTEEERDLLALVVSSGLTYQQIAEMTGTSLANVKVKIHRARKKLRNLLGADP